jgi:DNA-binding beta-propeller fold protein YncE
LSRGLRPLRAVATESRQISGRLALAVAVVLAAGFAFPTAGHALASLGELTQKAGTAGCIAEFDNGGRCVVGVALDDPESVVVSPDGKSAYVASFESDAVAVLDRAADGRLTQKAGTAGCISDTGSGGACVDGVALNGPVSVAVSPDGTSVYVASLFGGVAVLNRGADGTLSRKAGTLACISADGSGGACAAGRVLGFPNSVTVSPDGRSVYVTSEQDVVEVFDRAADGTLTQKAGTAGCIHSFGALGCADGKALDSPTSVIVSPDGGSVYVIAKFDDLNGFDGAVAVFDRAADGTLTQKAGTAGCISYENTSGGECVSGTGLNGANAVAMSPDGASLYVAGRADASVVVFDRAANGTLTQKAGTAGCIASFGGIGCAPGTALRGVTAVAVSPDGRSVYTASFENDAVAVFDRAADGTLTQKAGTAGCISETGAGSPGGGACFDGNETLDGATWLTVSPDGKSVYVTSQGRDAVSVFDRPLPNPWLPGVVRGSTQYLLRDSLSAGGPTNSFTYGTRPLVPLMGDWDGNGTRTVGAYEGLSGKFMLRNTNSSGPADVEITFGDRRGFALSGDFNGDGFDDLAVYRDGTWQIRANGVRTFSFGTGSWPDTIPVVGDWNNDGTDGIGTYNRATATWNLRQTADAGAPNAGTFVYGTPNASYPVVGDWNLDGTDTVGVKSTTGATWSLRNSNAAGSADITFNYGVANDLPLAWR